MREAAERGSDGQTFLVGETLYLRGLEAGDAERSLAWRDSPFPIPRVRAEEILKEDVPAEAARRRTRFVACRRVDDEPIGAVAWRAEDGRTADVTLSTLPALTADAAALKAEMLRLIVPWLSGERGMMTVWAEVDDGDAAVAAAASALGMREVARLREAVWREGARRDRVVHELLHPAWLERLGEPRGEAAAADGTAPTRNSSDWPPMADRSLFPVPPNAVLAGERVYLRPIEVEDWEVIARWARQETETFFRTGRWVGSPLIGGHGVRQMAKSDPPSDIEFAVALRDGGELIGEVGFYDIDWVRRTAETGSYLYRARHRGGGLGTEAKRLLLAYAFDRLGLHALRSYVWAPNTRSAAALRKQGYRDAGRLSWTVAAAGAFTDDLVFDLLAEEWRSRRG